MKTRNYMDTFTYDEAIELCKKEVDRILKKSPLLIRGYLSHLALSQGKYIRAVSVITCATDDDEKVNQDAITVAAAIEIIHLASLVHDDVIDNAKLRRGKETLQHKYDKKTAVICGDYLMSLALRLISELTNRNDYIKLSIPDYIGRLCLGELNQHINNHNLNLSIFQYLKIISGKTAALFEASFYAGAVVGKFNESESRIYKQIGFYIGMIFQLSDDCIDFDTTVEEANKPVQSDYEQGVITLPLIHALKQDEVFKQKALEGLISRSDINFAVEKSKGLDFTRFMIRKYYNKAINKVNELDASEMKKERLVTLLNKSARINPINL